eukprot:scaffold13277_cov114-Isochrysis_galbana.AAC.9
MSTAASWRIVRAQPHRDIPHLSRARRSSSGASSTSRADATPAAESTWPCHRLKLLRREACRRNATAAASSAMPTRYGGALRQWASARRRAARTHHTTAADCPSGLAAASSAALSQRCIAAVAARRIRRPEARDAMSIAVRHRRRTSPAAAQWGRLLRIVRPR